jgi:hypothetical protein
VVFCGNGDLWGHLLKDIDPLTPSGALLTWDWSMIISFNCDVVRLTVLFCLLRTDFSIRFPMQLTCIATWSGRGMYHIQGQD